MSGSAPRKAPHPNETSSVAEQQTNSYSHKRFNRFWCPSTRTLCGIRAVWGVDAPTSVNLEMSVASADPRGFISKDICRLNVRSVCLQKESRRFLLFIMLMMVCTGMYYLHEIIVKQVLLLCKSPSRMYLTQILNFLEQAVRLRAHASGHCQHNQNQQRHK